MIKLRDLIEENSNSIYNYGCVMLYFNFPTLEKIHNFIELEDIYTEEGDKTYGLEDEPHTTLLYGLHKEVSSEDVKSVLDHVEFGECKINNASLFENDNYDVLKFDVSSVSDNQSLHRANRLLKQFPYTSDFPNYHPHLTIGYIKKGLGQKYVNIFKTLEFELHPQYGVYSQPDGIKTKIKINE